MTTIKSFFFATIQDYQVTVKTSITAECSSIDFNSRARGGGGGGAGGFSPHPLPTFCEDDILFCFSMRYV